MNTKELIRGVVIAMLLMALWYGGVWWAKKTHPEWFVTTVPAAPEPTATPSTSPTTATAAATNSTTLPGVEGAAPTGGGLRAVSTGASPASVVVLGSAAKRDPTYAMQLTVNRQGGGIDSVRLNEFDITVKDNSPFVFQEPYAGHESATRALATRWISIDGNTVDLSTVDWNVRQSGDSAIASVDIGGAGDAVARVIKTFRISKIASETQGFEVDIDYRIENLSGAAIKVKTEFNGPVVPPQELAQGDRMALSGHQDGPKITPHTHLAQTFTAKKPSVYLLRDDENRKAYWAGGSSAFFDAILLPHSLTDPRQPADYLESIKAEGLDLSDDSQPLQRKVAIIFRTKEMEVKPKEALTLPMSAYFGPRKRQVLGSDYYSLLPRGYYTTLVISSGFCSICTFDWLIKGLVKLLTVFHFILRDWGLAIIALVILVRSILHPITKRSQINMLKMGKMGPELEKLKKKHGDNKDELNKAMMQFYKTQGATPILGCLPMFLQMPIWIALYSALQSTFELRHAPFLYGWTWIDDLSKPDGLLTWQQPIKLLFGIRISGLNVLPVLLGVVLWLNQKYTPKPPATTPEQAQQQKMMQWMTLLFPMFLYTGPSGLNLYILTSTAIGIIESKVIRDHIKQREELEKLNGPVIIDMPPTRGARRRDEPAEPVKKGGPMGWFADLQAKAEQIRKEAERGNKKS